ncbi:hypothetical protein [Noviherbaspirillum aerium]|uniref:hypothetical protein n=1 Tax=Noviherbaspirillum aerium TaxID=2588497 RepID=UPI00124D84AA|nr:hypothetical protein [Noviherbaspirillum aerium]
MRGLEARVQMALHTVYFGIGLTAPAARALLDARALAYQEGERASTEEGVPVPPLIADDSQLHQAYQQALLTRRE